MPRKQKSSGPAAPGPLAGPQRLNKLLAAAGLGSRRDVEQYILEGRVEVDGKPVTDLATKVDPETAKLTFDGSAIKIFRPVYFALNKPVGVLSTNRDPSGRMRIIDLVNVKERIFSAGRLDRSSEGLMLLTNDGELVQRLSHPRYGIQKLYLATVQGEITQADLEKLTRGVRLAEGYAKVDAAKVRKQRAGAAELEIALSEGKNREIRRILARLGHKVVGLKRLAIGPLRLGQLPTGGWRPLTKSEIQALYAAAVTGRRKKRGTGKPVRRKPEASVEEGSVQPVLAAGQFERYSDDDFEDDFGPSLDEMSDDELGGDDDYVVLSEPPVKGTVIPYEDEESDEGEEAPRTSRPRASHSRERSTRSPNDLRNRNRTSTPRSAPRSGYASKPKRSGPGSSSKPKSAGSYSKPKGASPSSSYKPKGAGSSSSYKPKSAGSDSSYKPKGASPGYSSKSAGSGASRDSRGYAKSARSGSRPAGSRPAGSAPRSSSSSSSGGKKFGGPKSGGPRSGGPKSGGRSFKGGPRKGGPRKGGPRK